MRFVKALNILSDMNPGRTESYFKWCYHMRCLLDTRRETYLGYDRVEVGGGIFLAAGEYEEQVKEHRGR